MYYEMLPIFKSAMDLVVYIETIVKGFDKYHKYTIGEDLRTQSKELLFSIQRANMSQDKQQEFLEFRNGCEVWKWCFSSMKKDEAEATVPKFGNGALAPCKKMRMKS